MRQKGCIRAQSKLRGEEDKISAFFHVKLEKMPASFYEFSEPQIRGKVRDISLIAGFTLKCETCGKKMPQQCMDGIEKTCSLV